MDVQVGTVDLLADARQPRQHRHEYPDGRDRVAVALEHRDGPAPEREQRGGEQDQSQHHPLRLLAREHGVDAIHHHDSHAREHRCEREQVGVGVRDRVTDHRMRGEAQAQEQRAIRQRRARSMVEREVGGRVRRGVLGLDEDRGEAGDDEQRRGDQAQELSVARAEHRPSVPRGCVANPPRRPLPWAHGHALARRARRPLPAPMRAVLSQITSVRLPAR